MNPLEQHHMVGEITKILLTQAPAGWNRIIMEYMTLGRKVNVGASARLTDGRVERFSPPRELAPLLSKLRRGMYVPGEGTWYSLSLIIDPPDRFSVRWNRKEQPPYPTPPDREQYALDQERFPRTPENMPEWFRHGLNG